ncbi:peptidylprolyl isomerase [Natronohydrobacter thiooxidans]|uniref:peptidylprolyl isomerase n=1 Tax=Natronohydrobacter thiooxidans TaxID=87172 RepID=UPI0008FF5A50|nr:peptidylprolyl isomerase [Natronohydrobacter thiooxidans]
MRFFQTSAFSRFALATGIVLGLVCASLPMAQAQSPFSPARKVNDRVISQYDVQQRMRFLEVLNSGGADLRADALQRLTDEAVQRDYAQRRNVRVNRDEINDGITEFASRAEMTAAEFIAALGEAGVDRETIVSFVEAGLLWRKLVGAELPILVAVSGSDAARARDTAAIVGTQRALLSEIFLPMDPEFAEAVQQIMGMIESARSIEEFAQIAREFSLAGSRDQGGRLPDWVPVENLPGQLGALVREGRAGQIIGPLELSGAIAYFQIRALDSQRDIPADRVKLTYQRLLLPGGRSEANLARVAQMRAQVTNCASLGPFARGLPEAALVEHEALMQSIPQSDAVELARLDRGEISANTTEGGNLVVLMLCARELEFEDRPSDSRLRDMIFEERLSAMADVKLQELVADAEIIDY